MTTIARNIKPPAAWNWNFTVQRQLWFQSVLEVAYVGHRGLDLPQVYDINQPQPGTVVSGTNVNYVRPYRGFAAIQMEESVATSTYNGLQVTWNRRFNNGFSFGFVLHAVQEHGQWIQLSRHRSGRLQRFEHVGTVGIRFAPRSGVQLRVHTAVLQGPEQDVRKVAGRLADQRRESVPDGNAVQRIRQHGLCPGGRSGQPRLRQYAPASSGI